jgi:hypothetical protein
MTHWGDKNRHVAVEPGSLLALIRRLELVLYVAVLNDLGLNGDEVRGVIGSGWRLEGLP